MFQGKKNHTKFDPVIRRPGPRRKRVLFVKRFKKPKLSLRWSLAGVFVCLVSAVFVYFFFISDKFLLKEVIVEGTDNKELKENVEKHYNTVSQIKKFYFMRQNKTFSFPKDNFEV